jgi:NADPH-dependent 2,4-dienoyl-CoA reductase/sulfur reductase-like enzyme/nitrite reductase/ring-hydroxylating ferredoxin subunit
MGEGQGDLSGPDLAQGLSLEQIGDGAMLPGHAKGEPVLLARVGTEIFAIGTSCTHYSGPLAEGLLVGDTVRCPWHHACFSLRSGEALRAPALNPVACWQVDRRGDKVFVGEKKPAPAQDPRRRTDAPAETPRAIVILGGGGAAQAAAEMLRRRGYAGSLAMVSADDAPPCDRPNLSKEYLAGSAPEEWIPLRPPEFYREQSIELRLGVRAKAIDVAGQVLTLESGEALAYDRLLLATGATPVALKVPGADLGHVHYLRSLDDSRRLIAKAETSKRAVVVGASFIGLEVAASLRARKIEVDVVAPEARPLERVMGPQIGEWIRQLHESHGVRFHLGAEVVAIEKATVTLASGALLPCDLVVVGIGVRPAIELAERAGLATDRGVAVDEYLQTNAPHIFAAGDIARWPDRLTGERIRVEHWVVAERQGQVAALNMLGGRQPFDAVPFFWSQHYDRSVRYVGHAPSWDEIEIDGRLDMKGCTVTYRRAGRKLAVATILRDRENLQAEVELERMART